MVWGLMSAVSLQGVEVSRAQFASFDLNLSLLTSPLWDAPDPFGTRLFALTPSAPTYAAEGSTLFGFLGAGVATLTSARAGTFALSPGMYFSLPGPGHIQAAPNAWGIAVERPNYSAFFTLGGPVELAGRLRYIDGCTDSLLLSPVRWGDPCLNLLHLPPNTRQSPHTHPSIRAGLILSGHGRCVLQHTSIALHPGLAFVIPAQTLHCFHTDAEPLRVIAYHPDSDFGPRDEDHPMINRTFIQRPPNG